ncbi:MAG: DHH family phosphoesterase, partial [Lachnospiraceae bacterium]|nr:DHH family phosphoesterase [Lachnospiraceae bacterium]
MSKNKKIRPFIRSIIMWPLYLAVILIIMNIYVYFLDTNAGRVVTLFLTVYLAGVVVFILIKREQINEQLVRFGASYGQVQKNLIKEMAVPYALLDGDGRLLSANNEFMAMCPDKIKLKVGIGQIFPEITKNVLPADREKSVVHLTMNDKKYCAELKNIYIDDSDWNEDKKSIVEDRDNVLISIFFYDETEILRLQKYLTDRQLVVALLYIDNYEEALESIDEVRRSLLSALIDRKINKYFQEYQVLLKKIEKDKYLIVFQNQYLEELKGARFTILDEVRDVNIGNEMAVTVSMGIGTGTDSYTDSYEAAHAAIDLALG